MSDNIDEKTHLKTNNLYLGDCLKLSEDIKDNSLNLVITSPPYADTVKYGNEVKNLKSYQYIDWITKLFNTLYNKVKMDGSFILNINDKIDNGFRSTYVYQLIISITTLTNWKLYDRYIWFKKAALPSTNQKRLNDRIEYIFHFVKSKNFKCNMDDVREPYKEVTLKRFKNKMHGNDKVLAKWLTDENDIVLDPFIGSGTVAISCIKSKRQYIGIDINSKYIKDAKERIKKME